MRPDQLEGGSPVPEAPALLRLLIDARFIEQLEQQRNGGGPVTIKLWINIHYRALSEYMFPNSLPVTGKKTQEAILVKSLSHPLQSQVQFDVVLQRDQWIGLLGDLQWDEFQVFEVAVRTMTGMQGFNKARSHLQAAQLAFRQGESLLTPQLEWEVPRPRR